MISRRNLSRLKYLVENPPRLVYAFHRISPEKQTDAGPFHRLGHTTPKNLDRLIRRMKPFSTFGNLEEVLSASKQDRWRLFIHLTFDDVPKSFLPHGLEIIEKHDIPVTLFPSVKNAETGYSWRDKIYYIIGKAALEDDLTKRITEILRPESALDPRDIYHWSKSIQLPHDRLENIIDLTLAPVMDHFKKAVETFRPYLNWTELRELAEHPLITIGNHGCAHYDYRRLDPQDIEKDVITAHQMILDRLGVTCRHFAVPFGGLDQNSYLTLDKTLDRLRYRTVGWSERVSNPRWRGDLPRHYFRIDGGNHFLINAVKAFKAAKKPKNFPLSGIPFFSKKRPDLTTTISEDVSLEEYKTFYRRLFPDKLHHTDDSYLNHLYFQNPFSREKSVHFAIKAGGDIWALASVLHLPFLVDGRKVPGAYFCGWYRFPELPAADVRARALFEKALELTPVLGAYKPSANSLHFYNGWDRIRIYGLKKRLRNRQNIRLSASSSLSSSWHTAEEWDDRLEPIAEQCRKDLKLTLLRGEEVYRWRIEGYPLCRFHYLYPEGEAPAWYAVYCIQGQDMIVSDFCLKELENPKEISKMIKEILQCAGINGVRTVKLETSNRAVLSISRKQGFQVEESFWTVYKHPASSGIVLPWQDVHETQISGDLLPRIYPPQKD
ncbi:MAG: polysaccharide deacetylase family protein [Acidobacteria bacterium]|nr:polysaccharide deacetylase family protein [Acidobacteriota bacterium]